MADISVKNIDEMKLRKAIFILKCKGSNLSKTVKEKIDELAEEFDNNK